MTQFFVIIAIAFFSLFFPPQNQPILTLFVFISLSTYPRIFLKNFKNNPTSPSHFKEMIKCRYFKWNQLDALGRGKLAYTVNEHDSNIEGRVLEAGKGGHLKPLVYIVKGASIGRLRMKGTSLEGTHMHW